MFLNIYITILSIFYYRYTDIVIYNNKECMFSDKDQYWRLQMKLKTDEEFHQALKNRKELEGES